MEKPQTANAARHGQSEGAFAPGFIFEDDAFSRIDESDDSLFYQRDRFVQHLDSLALSTVEKLIGELIVEESPVILDLMAGWDSHIPPMIHAARVVGLGLNGNELSRNKALTESCLHDLNRNPILPFPDHFFDAVLNVVSVDYMTRPIDVFREVGRVLKPGGLFLVVFSNRMFEEKAVKIWRQSGEEERLLLVEKLFNEAGTFTKPEVFVSKGKPRPRDDKYAHLGIPSDPIYAVYAEKLGGRAGKRPNSSSTALLGARQDKEALARREATVKETLRCPHCGERLLKWAVPQSPFSEWDVDHMYLCFNDECPYLVRGWEIMRRQGNRGLSYRFAYHSVRDKCLSVPVPNLFALRDGIIEETG